MKHSIKTFLVAVSACFSALVAVSSLQGCGLGSDGKPVGGESRARSASLPSASDPMSSSHMAHVIGEVLLPPTPDRALHFYPVVPNPR